MVGEISSLAPPSYRHRLGSVQFHSGFAVDPRRMDVGQDKTEDGCRDGKCRCERFEEGPVGEVATSMVLYVSCDLGFACAGCCVGFALEGLVGRSVFCRCGKIDCCASC